MSKMEVNMVKNVLMPYETYKKGNYVSVTEWPNGEGYSISIWEDGSVQAVEISYEAFDALIAARSMINIADVNEDEQ